MTAIDMLPSLAAYVHDIDPYLIKLWEGGPIRWYGMSYLVGFAIGYLLIRRIVAAGRTPLGPRDAIDLVTTVAIAIVVGGRLGYAFFYKPEMLVGFSSSFPWWELLEMHKGGLASHGGMIGGCAGCLWFAWRRRLPAMHVIDLMAFSAPPGLFFGRLANFINGELYGRACDPNFPLAVKFPQEMYDDPGIAQRAVDTVAWAGRLDTSAVADPVYWIVNRIQQGDEAIKAIVEPMLTPRHPSQFYAAATEGVLVGFVLLVTWAKPKKPGVIAGTFGIAYALARIGNEFFRMPDHHLLEREFAALSITRGQWLSGLLLLAGGAVVTWSLRRKTDTLGGWRKSTA